MPTAQIIVNKGEFGFEPLILVFAESLKTAPWWRYHTLIAGDNSEKLGVDDPDNWCVYNFSTKAIVWQRTHTPANMDGHIFRIHDGVTARILKVNDTYAHATATGGVTGKSGVHRCIDENSGPGKINKVKDTAAKSVPCGDRKELMIDSLGLAFPWAFPSHLKYESKNNLQWVAP
jgi:hypothetical protein